MLKVEEIVYRPTPDGGFVEDYRDPIDPASIVDWTVDAQGAITGAVVREVDVDGEDLTLFIPITRLVITEDPDVAKREVHRQLDGSPSNETPGGSS